MNTPPHGTLTRHLQPDPVRIPPPPRHGGALDTPVEPRTTNHTAGPNSTLSYDGITTNRTNEPAVDVTAGARRSQQSVPTSHLPAQAAATDDGERDRRTPPTRPRRRPSQLTMICASRRARPKADTLTSRSHTNVSPAPITTPRNLQIAGQSSAVASRMSTPDSVPGSLRCGHVEFGDDLGRSQTNAELTGHAVAGAELLGTIRTHVAGTGQRGDAPNLGELFRGLGEALHLHEAVGRLFEVDGEHDRAGRERWLSPSPRRRWC